MNQPPNSSFDSTFTSTSTSNSSAPSIPSSTSTASTRAPTSSSSSSSNPFCGLSLSLVPVASADSFTAPLVDATHPLLTSPSSSSPSSSCSSASGSLHHSDSNVVRAAKDVIAGTVGGITTVLVGRNNINTNKTRNACTYACKVDKLE